MSKVDCTACGRTGVTVSDSIDLCNRVNCPPFDHFRASVPKPVLPDLTCYCAYSTVPHVHVEAIRAHYGPAYRVVDPAPATQSRTDSVIEVAVNIIIGAAVSLAAQAIIFPLYGIHASAGTHIGIVAWFTVVSVARQYVIRRCCNGRSPYRWFKEKFQ